MNVLFYISAAVATVATFMVITRLNAVHGLLYMVVSLLAVALVFYSLGATFVAALEAIVYAGAIMVLFVFVIMMLDLGHRSIDREGVLLSGRMWIGPSVLSVILVAEVVYLVLRSGEGRTSGRVVPPTEVGTSLFSAYLLGVELASMLLLAGLVAAYHLARPHRRAAPPFEEGSDG